MVLHQLAFVVYVILSVVVAFLMVGLESRIAIPLSEPTMPPQPNGEIDLRPLHKSHAVKMAASAAMLIELVLLANFYLKHRRNCTPLSYSAFNFTELLFAVTMLVFESTAIVDFRHLRLRFEPSSARTGSLKGY